MSRLVSLILTVAACAANPPHGALANLSTSAASAPAIAGIYRAPHVVRMRCDGGDDGWCDEHADDQMTIHDAEAGSIAVTIELVQTNAHTCSFEGTLRATAAHESHRRWRFEGHDEDGACSLVIEQGASSIQLSSEGCRYYCGARASLDAVFPAKPQ